MKTIERVWGVIRYLLYRWCRRCDTIAMADQHPSSLPSSSSSTRPEWRRKCGEEERQKEMERLLSHSSIECAFAIYRAGFFF